MPDVRVVSLGLARLVGSHPTLRPPLPGSKKPRQGIERRNQAI